MKEYNRIGFILFFLTFAALIILVLVSGFTCEKEYRLEETKPLEQKQQEERSSLTKGITEYTICSWVPKYDSCFCGNTCQGCNWATLTWVPDKVCGH
jgi:hypothetical protein